MALHLNSRPNIIAYKNRSLVELQLLLELSPFLKFVSLEVEPLHQQLLPTLSFEPGPTLLLQHPTHLNIGTSEDWLGLQDVSMVEGGHLVANLLLLALEQAQLGLLCRPGRLLQRLHALPLQSLN